MKTKKKCLTCGKEHNRKKFCSNKCKDRWHNTHNIERYERACYYSDIDFEDNYMHPLDGDNFNGEW